MIFKKDLIPGTKSYRIVFDFEKMGATWTKGSYNIMPARLLGLSYANYLRMCRDFYGATLNGEGLYITPRFPNSKKLDEFIKELNARADLVMWNRKHGDFKEHERTVAEYKKDVNNLLKEIL